VPAGVGSLPDVVSELTMNAGKSIMSWVAPVAILAGGIAAFLLLGSQPPPERKVPDAPAAAPVRTAEVEAAAEGITIRADGVVVPLREVTLATQVAGRVLRKSEACNEGQFVTAGTVLFEIDPRDYELDVSRLERELSQAGLTIEEVDEEVEQNVASMTLAERQVELARREVARLDTLKAGKIVTESEYDRAVRDELTASNALTTLQGQRRVLVKRRNRLLEAQSLASTMLEKAKLDLARTRIVAPIDGIVVEDKVEQESFVAKGAPLVTIEDTRSAEVRTNLEMEQVARVWGARREEAGGTQSAHGEIGMPADVVFTVGDAVYQWKGVLSRQEGRGLDERTRTLPCRVLVPEPGTVEAIDRYGAVMPQLPPGAPRSLLRGMFVEVHVHLDSPGKLVTIPEEALRPSGDVWVVREGKLVMVQPTPVDVVGGRVILEAVDSGLEPGDRVVVSQLAAPRPGMAVAEVEPAGSGFASGGDAP